MKRELSRGQSFDHPDGRVYIEELNNGKRRIHAQPRDSSVYIHRPSCDTAYPIELITQILAVKGPGYVCDDISRDEDSSYLESHLRATLFAHLPNSRLPVKRCWISGADLVPQP